MKNNPFEVLLPASQTAPKAEKPKHAYEFMDADGNELRAESNTDADYVVRALPQHASASGFGRSVSEGSTLYGFEEESTDAGGVSTDEPKDSHGYAIHIREAHEDDRVHPESEDEILTTTTTSASTEAVKKAVLSKPLHSDAEEELFKNNPFLSAEGDPSEKEDPSAGLAPPPQPFLMRQRSHSESDVRVLNANAERIVKEEQPKARSPR